MKYIGTFALILIISGCSSAPTYEKMQTVDERFANDEDVKPGMALTRHGAVIDIKVEEVQAQKARLEAENAELRKRLKDTENDLAQERLKTMALKLHDTSRAPTSEKGADE